ncbi:hypothetical protein [Nocardia jiangxiensis]|uniref:hypothetical protein n=1 Tax=Nocardia jiangxiensis TaxID=282685 RepID=UPI00059378D5|nr:hypothetical protein [Nocardia jiangxiensis]
MVIAVTDPLYSHMFVTTDSRFAEDLCRVELLDPLSTARARELAEIHHDHSLDECRVLRAAVERLKTETSTTANAEDLIHRSIISASSPSVVEVPFLYCRIDPGPISAALGRMLAHIHRHCEEDTCRAKQRGRQATKLDGALTPVPDCRVPRDQIAAVVARVTAARATLQAAEVALRAGERDATTAMIAASIEFVAARRARDVMVRQALPADGTVPVWIITLFGLSLHELRRLVPGLRISAAPPDGHDQ